MSGKKPLITAHSGCEGTGIDTMESVEKALLFGADAVEIDVRMDPFGDLRISHDPLSIEDYFKKNPLEDLQALRTVKLVMARGRLYDKPAVKRKAIVDAQLDQYLQAKD